MGQISPYRVGTAIDSLAAQSHARSENHLMPRPTLLRTVLTTGAILFATASIAGCSAVSDLLDSGGAQRDEETNEVTEEGTDSVFEISVGDCLLEPDGEEVSDVTVVPCDQPHDYEFFHEFDLPEGEWPGNEAVWEQANAGCEAEFENFAGIAFQDSATLWYNNFTPTEGTWGDGDRLVQCLIYEASDEQGQEIVQVTGTLAGAAR